MYGSNSVRLAYLFFIMNDFQWDLNSHLFMEESMSLDPTHNEKLTFFHQHLSVSKTIGYIPVKMEELKVTIHKLAKI